MCPYRKCELLRKRMTVYPCRGSVMLLLMMIVWKEPSASMWCSFSRHWILVKSFWWTSSPSPSAHPTPHLQHHHAHSCSRRGTHAKPYNGSVWGLCVAACNLLSHCRHCSWHCSPCRGCSGGAEGKRPAESASGTVIADGRVAAGVCQGWLEFCRWVCEGYIAGV